MVSEKSAQKKIESFQSKLVGKVCPTSAMPTFDASGAATNDIAKKVVETGLNNAFDMMDQVHTMMYGEMVGESGIPISFKQGYTMVRNKMIDNVSQHQQHSANIEKNFSKGKALSADESAAFIQLKAHEVAVRQVENVQKTLFEQGMQTNANPLQLLHYYDAVRLEASQKLKTELSSKGILNAETGIITPLKKGSVSMKTGHNDGIRAIYKPFGRMLESIATGEKASGMLKNEELAHNNILQTFVGKNLLVEDTSALDVGAHSKRQVILNKARGLGIVKNPFYADKNYDRLSWLGNLGKTGLVGTNIVNTGQTLAESAPLIEASQGVYAKKLGVDLDKDIPKLDKEQSDWIQRHNASRGRDVSGEDLSGVQGAVVNTEHTGGWSRAADFLNQGLSGLAMKGLRDYTGHKAMELALVVARRKGIDMNSHEFTGIFSEIEAGMQAESHLSHKDLVTSPAFNMGSGRVQIFTHVDAWTAMADSVAESVYTGKAGNGKFFDNDFWKGTGVGLKLGSEYSLKLFTGWFSESAEKQLKALGHLGDNSIPNSVKTKMMGEMVFAGALLGVRSSMVASTLISLGGWANALMTGDKDSVEKIREGADRIHLLNTLYPDLLMSKNAVDPFDMASSMANKLLDPINFLTSIHHLTNTELGSKTYDIVEQELTRSMGAFGAPISKLSKMVRKSTDTLYKLKHRRYDSLGAFAGAIADLTSSFAFIMDPGTTSTVERAIKGASLKEDYNRNSLALSELGRNRNLNTEGGVLGEGGVRLGAGLGMLLSGQSAYSKHKLDKFKREHASVIDQYLYKLQEGFQS